MINKKKEMTSKKGIATLHMGLAGRYGVWREKFRK